jgi:formimidoylglutamate deiminase
LLRGVIASRANATGFATMDDRVTLDKEAPQFAGMTAGDAIDRWIFSGNRNLVRDVHVGGQALVIDGRHRERDAIAARFRAAMSKLLA